MPAMASPHLMIEKNFRRLLLSTEKRLEDKTIEDWKLNQFVNTLTDMLNDMRKSMARPSTKQLDEYKKRIDLLRQNVDPVKLEDQTFPRQQLLPPQIQTESHAHVQPSEISAPSAIVSRPEKQLSTSNKSDRPNLNRIQQHVLSEEDKQNDIAVTMRSTTRSILTSARQLNDIVRDDRKKLAEAETLIDTNTAKLSLQSKRLKHNAYNGSNCWIYLMLIIVIVTFIYLTLFMRMFSKRISTTVSHSNARSSSSSTDDSANQTSINITNSTKSTDYISLLLNYANENHTDL